MYRPIKTLLVFYTLTLLVLSSALFLPANIFAAEINLSRSKLLQLAQRIEADDIEKHYYFSQISLLEMYSSYEYELERSITHIPKTMKKRAKVRHWRFALHSYMETLNEYLFLMDSGVESSYFINRQNKIFLLIGGVPVIISGPNSGADKQIEKNIVEQFCLLYDCQEYFAKEDSPAEQLFFNDSSPDEWSIKSRHDVSYIMANGLTFNFSSMQKRPEKEVWANELMAELTLLLDYLHRTKDKGKQIEWSMLSIEALPLTDNAYKLIINQHEDYIKISLPLLGGNPDFFYSFIPWLEKYFSHQLTYRMIINDADKHFKNQGR